MRSLDWEDPLEEGISTHPSLLAWRIPRTEEPGRMQSLGRTELDMTEELSTHASPFKKFQTVYINFSSCYVCVKWGGGKKKLNMYKEKVSSLA